MTVGTLPAAVEQRMPSRKGVPRLSTSRLAVTEALGQRVLALPFHTGLGGADIQRIADLVGAVE